MWVSRIRVTGGFLTDLDVELTPGLNVVIGPRGAGKTTLLELLRHALGVSHADARRQASQTSRIREMLGAGEVIVDLESETESIRVVVDAEGGGRRPDLAGAALMLGQNELETIASDAPSRLNLIDLRAQVKPPAERSAAIIEHTRQLVALRTQAEGQEEQLAQRESLIADEQVLVASEDQMLREASTDLTETREQLTAIEDRLASVQESLTQVARFEGSLDELSARIPTLIPLAETMVVLPLPEPLVETAGPQAAALVGDLVTVGERLASLRNELDAFVQTRRALELELRGSAAPLRSLLDESERGLGDLTARLRNLRSQIARLDALALELGDLRALIEATELSRDAALQADEARDELRFEAREQVASRVSSQLDGRVVISVAHLADSARFRETLTSLLQGSGLQYRALVEAIGRRTLPRQLLEIVEARDAGLLASIVDIPLERAQRTLAHLDNADALTRIAAVVLEDSVDFLLRDGATTKSVEQLSTGQKCAVTLPILLTEHSRTLVLDQPEDHLDNAYLVDNIVEALKSRQDASAQTIVATHNANIPVLGGARMVLSLRSDGTRGYVDEKGPFESQPIVRDITTLMEGGREAFQQRASFYASHD